MQFVCLRYRDDETYQVNTYASKQTCREEIRRAIRHQGADLVEVFEREQGEDFGDGPYYSLCFWVEPLNVDDFA